MTCQVLTLQLIKGVPSPYSLGAPSTDPYDPTPLIIDFLTGVWKVKDMGQQFFFENDDFAKSEVLTADEAVTFFGGESYNISTEEREYVIPEQLPDVVATGIYQERLLEIIGWADIHYAPVKQITPHQERRNGAAVMGVVASARQAVVVPQNEQAIPAKYIIEKHGVKYTSRDVWARYSDELYHLHLAE